MAAPPAVEITCSFTVVDCVPLNPFSWALLRTLESFAAGERPDFDELSTRLCVGDSSFFHQAWEELVDLRLVTVRDYQTTDVAHRGKVARVQGFVSDGEPSRRDEVLFFLLRDGAPVQWKNHFVVTQLGLLGRPHWADSITEEKIAQAIVAQVDESRQLGENQKITQLDIEWATAQRVQLD